MKFIDKLYKQCKQNNIDKISKKRTLKFDYCNRKNIHINGVESKLKVIKIKNSEMFNNFIDNNNFEDNSIVYIISATNYLSVSNLEAEIDVIVCDLSWNVVDLHASVNYKHQAFIFDKISHVFVLAKNMIKNLGIKVNTNFRPF